MNGIGPLEETPIKISYLFVQCEDTGDIFYKPSHWFSLSTNLLEHLCLTFLTFRAMRNKWYLLASPASHSLFQPEWAQAYPVSLLISRLNFDNLNMCAQMCFFNNYFSPVWVYWNLWTCELMSSVNFKNNFSYCFYKYPCFFIPCYSNYTYTVFSMSFPRHLTCFFLLPHFLSTFSLWYSVGISLMICKFTVLFFFCHGQFAVPISRTLYF